MKTIKGIVGIWGVEIILLTAGGMLAFYIKPEKADDLWKMIQPILYLSLGGLLSFVGVKARSYQH